MKIGQKFDYSEIGLARTNWKQKINNQDDKNNLFVKN